MPVGINAVQISLQCLYKNTQPGLNSLRNNFTVLLNPVYVNWKPEHNRFIVFIDNQVNIHLIIFIGLILQG